MPIPLTKLRAAIAAMDDEIEALGEPTVFTLRDGTTFTIKTLSANLTDADMTEGLVQGRLSLKFMASRWHAGAGVGRPPEKGDQFIRNDRRQAIEYVYCQTNAGVDVGYIIQVRG